MRSPRPRTQGRCMACLRRLMGTCTLSTKILCFPCRRPFHLSCGATYAEQGHVIARSPDGPDVAWLQVDQGIATHHSAGSAHASCTPCAIERAPSVMKCAPCDKPCRARNKKRAVFQLLSAAYERPTAPPLPRPGVRSLLASPLPASCYCKRFF